MKKSVADLCVLREPPKKLGICGDSDAPSSTENTRALQRPRNRGDCVAGPRPCPWSDCRYHFAAKTAADWVIAKPSCVLDVADEVEAGGEPSTLAVMAAWEGGLTHERIRQIENRAIDKLARVGVSLLGERERTQPKPGSLSTACSFARRNT